MRRLAVMFAASVLLLSSGVLLATDTKPQPIDSQQPISKEGKFMLIRGLNAEFVFVRRLFPMGTKGLTLHDGQVTPTPDQAMFMAAQTGPAARPGDRAQITDVVIRDKSITFEINGGPKKKKKWWEHIAVGGMGGMTSLSAPDDPSKNPHGSFVNLEFDHYVPALTPEQVKQLLAPVFDFSSLSATEAYIDTMPPKIKQAMKNHEVLVGMNREMVSYSKGRPDQKVREKDELGQYEEWIYGTPPQEVEFVRFYGDVAKRVEIMKVDGEKIVRTQPEVDVLPSGMAQQTASATPAPNVSPAGTPSGAPSLRRPGEELPNNTPSDGQPAPLGPPVNSGPPPSIGPNGPQ